MSYLEIVLLGAGLATDASCVCTSNGLVYQPELYTIIKMALVYAIFQFAMPVIGFLGASLLPKAIYQYNHVIACVLLCYIGAKMYRDARRESNEKHEVCPRQRESAFTNKILLAQGIATSIDALSVGFTLSGMALVQVLQAAGIIAMVTFLMCFTFAKVGIFIGDKVNAQAERIGGMVLIALELKLFVDGCW